MILRDALLKIIPPAVRKRIRIHRYGRTWETGTTKPAQGVSSCYVIAKTGADSKAVRRELRAMVEDGLLSMDGPTNGPCYHRLVDFAETKRYQPEALAQALGMGRKR